MNTASTYLATLDHLSNRLQPDTSSFRAIPLLDDHNAYYLDPDYGFHPYWDTHSYNQHHLYFYKIFDKQTQYMEPDSLESDNTLNVTLANACVDIWQRTRQFTQQPTVPEPENEISRGEHRSPWLQQLLRAL